MWGIWGPFGEFQLSTRNTSIVNDTVSDTLPFENKRKWAILEDSNLGQRHSALNAELPESELPSRSC